MEEALESVLNKIKSGNQLLIREAEQQCNAWEKDAFAHYIFTLCAYMVNPGKDVHNRDLAGILLKGLLSAKDEELVRQKAQRWFQGVPPEARTKIKEGLVSLLASPDKGPRQKAAQSIASVALIELPQNAWPELISILLNNVTDMAKTPFVKQASLDTIGFICEEIEPDVLKGVADQILTAVVHGMRPDEQNAEVKKSACDALFNALSFCRQNFENRQECEVLMSVILEATVNTDNQVRVKAYYILVEVAGLHYDRLAPFMQRIFKITLEAIKTAHEDVAKQAVEFWCTICEEEIAIMEETDRAQEHNLPPPKRVCQYYIKGALQFLVDVITETLTKQADNPDPEELTLAMAGGTCLDLIARTVEDDIVMPVMPFIERNLMAPDWKLREAAVLAFGSIMEGPTTNIGKLITQAAPVLLNFMKDPKTALKDTTAWTWGRILQMHHTAVIQYSEEILKVMYEALLDKPRVAANAAWAIHNLAHSMRDEPTNPLQKYFNDIVLMLMRAGDRNDGDDDNLRSSTYEALNVVLLTAPDNMLDSVKNIAENIVVRLEQTFTTDVAAADKIMELQGLLCGVLQVIIQRIDDKILPLSDRIVRCVFHLFKTRSDASSIHEEAFLTIGALTNAINEDFNKHMAEFNDILCNGLHNWQEHQVCAVAVGVVGDVARALTAKLAPYCDRIITLLLQNLQNKYMERTVKPPILSCFGDIALAIGGSFERYLEVVMRIIKQASDMVVQTNYGSIEDADFLDYMNGLREAIFEAYTGIVQGLRTDRKGDLIQPYVQHILVLVNHVAADPRRSEAVSRCAVGLCGDIAATLRARSKGDLHKPYVEQLINETMQRATTEETKETAEWARSVIAGL